MSSSRGNRVRVVSFDRMSPRNASGVLLAALFAAGCSTQAARPPIEIAALPSAEAAVRSERELDDYPRALTAIMNTFEQSLGLPRADVTLVLFANRRSFEQGLLKTGYTPELARAASAFAAIGGARQVFVNADFVARHDRAGRIQQVAHQVVD
jgi:hypothetical protein